MNEREDHGLHLARLDAEVVDGFVDDELDDVDELDEDFEALYLKYEFDGVGPLEVLAASLRALAAEVELKAALGWELAAPVDGGWVHLTPLPR